MKQKLIGAIATVVSAILATAAAAQTNDGTGWYGSLGYTQTQIQGGDVGSVDARFGRRLTPYFGAEGELSVGVNGDTAPDIGPNVTQRLNAAIAGYGVAYLPVTKSIDLLARLGVGESQFEYNDSSVHTRLDTTSLNYGAGAIYHITPVNALRFDYTRKSYDQTGLNANTYGLSFVHRF